jgi:hypothetical protein
LDLYASGEKDGTMDEEASGRVHLGAGQMQAARGICSKERAVFSVLLRAAVSQTGSTGNMKIHRSPEALSGVCTMTMARFILPRLSRPPFLPGRRDTRAVYSGVKLRSTGVTVGPRLRTLRSIVGASHH